ncbi:MAG: hypothetical protein HKN44_06030, partial [Ilumatobacter sp.]|nr:hypothetical protein [Ilumatobacter sp.]
MKDGRSSTSLIAVGIVVLVVGMLCAVGLWYSAGQRYDDAVRNLARAPVGCVTTLDFAETGNYLLFVETRGTISDVVGDCGSTGDFEWTEDRDPTVGVTLIDPRDAAVELDSADGVTYDAAGSAGFAVQSFRVDTAGDHLLTVADADPGFAIAVGRDPNDGVTLLRIGAALAAIAGLVIGGAMLVLASRRSKAAPAAAPGWLPAPPGGAIGVPG